MLVPVPVWRVRGQQLLLESTLLRRAEYRLPQPTVPECRLVEHQACLQQSLSMYNFNQTPLPLMSKLNARMQEPQLLTMLTGYNSLRDVPWGKALNPIPISCL